MNRTIFVTLFSALVMIAGYVSSQKPVAAQRKSALKFINQNQPTSAPAESAMLLQVVTMGGRLACGPCHHEFVVNSDGVYISTLVKEGKVIKKKEGKIEKAEMDELAWQINNADFKAIRSKKFVGVCKIAIDLPALSYTFHTSRGAVSIHECKTAIDYNSPLFRKASEIVSKIW